MEFFLKRHTYLECVLCWLDLTDFWIFSEPGRKNSEETRRKISESNKGKEVSNEIRKKISEAGKGKNNYRRLLHKGLRNLRGRNIPQDLKSLWLIIENPEKKNWENPEYRKHMREMHKGKKQF